MATLTRTDKRTKQDPEVAHRIALKRRQLELLYKGLILDAQAGLDDLESHTDPSLYLARRVTQTGQNLQRLITGLYEDLGY